MMVRRYDSEVGGLPVFSFAGHIGSRLVLEIGRTPNEADYPECTAAMCQKSISQGPGQDLSLFGF